MSGARGLRNRSFPQSVRRGVQHEAMDRYTRQPPLHSLQRQAGAGVIKPPGDAGGTNMWKQNEAVNPPSGPSGTPGAFTPPPASHTRSERHAPIGPSVVIKGELHGNEDLTIEGVVEGTIELREHVLTIGPHGRIKAQVVAKSVVVLGQVTGDVTALEKVDIREKGSVDGDLAAPRLAIAAGAHFCGRVDMQKTAVAQPASGKDRTTVSA